MTLRRRKTGLIVTVGLIIICLTLNMFIPIYKENGIHLGESSRSLAKRLELINSTSPSNNNKTQQIILPGPVYSIVKLIDYEKTEMDTLEPSQIIDYLLWTNQPSCQMAQYFGGRMVTSADGLSVALDGQKAICLDSAVAPIPDNCLVYSFGISHEWSFDQAMELYGCQVYAFDPSMNVSDHNRTEAIHFYQMALGDLDRDGWNEEADVPSRTLSSIYNMLKPLHGGDSIIDYLKMDIEATEWRVLPQIIQSGMMDKVRQLAVEIHLDYDESLSVYRQQAGILRSLEDYGMVRFDSKRNMFTVVDFTQVPGNLAAAVDYEIAWYNSKLLRV